MKKTYKIVAWLPSPEGGMLMLDGKPARSPAGKPFAVHDAALGKAIALEWQSQGEVVRKETMPLTQLAAIAIDLLAERRAEVVADLLAYAETDLVCYRAGDAPDLLRSQAKMLDPIVSWAKERFRINLNITDGVMPVSQPAENHAMFQAAIDEYDRWKLAALAAIVKPLGSLILALALIEGRINAEQAFSLSHLEEAYETGKWGRDEEKEKRLVRLGDEIGSVERFLALLMSSKN